jgi:hypothetical protein
MGLVWIKNPSGAVHQVDEEFAQLQVTGGPNAPEDFDNGGLEVISEEEALELLGAEPKVAR